MFLAPSLHFLVISADVFRFYLCINRSQTNLSPSDPCSFHPLISLFVLLWNRLFTLSSLNIFIFVPKPLLLHTFSAINITTSLLFNLSLSSVVGDCFYSASRACFWAWIRDGSIQLRMILTGSVDITNCTTVLFYGHPYPFPQQVLCLLRVEVIVPAHCCPVFPLALKTPFGLHLDEFWRHQLSFTRLFA